MVLKKIQESSATCLNHPKIVERQFRRLGTVLVIMRHLQLGKLSHYPQVYPQNRLRHWGTLICSRPLHVLDTRPAVGVVSSRHPTKAIAMAQGGLGVTEVEKRTETGDGVRLLNIGGHHFWLAYRQMIRLEEI